MKKLLLIVLMVTFVFGMVELNAEKPRVGVLRFTNRTSAGWWHGSVGTDLQDMLISELFSTKAFQVLERKEINAVLSEQDLSASGRISKATMVKMGKIKGAKYLVAATVSAYEEDVKKSGGGVRVGGLRVGGGGGKTYLAVDLKVIDTETSEIVDTRTIEAKAKKGGMTVGFSSGKFGGNLGQYQKTPAGKAIRACIVYISDYLKCSLVQGLDAPCMKKWDKMEEKRRKKTKDSISLD